MSYNKIIFAMGHSCRGKMGQTWYNLIDGGNMLKEYRIRKGLSQEQLEKLTDIDRKTIFRIENDLNTPLVTTFVKITKALNLTDQEIINELKQIEKDIRIAEKNK